MEYQYLPLFLFNRKLRFLLNKNASQGGALRAEENGCVRSRAPALVCAAAYTFMSFCRVLFPAEEKMDRRRTLL